MKKAIHTKIHSTKNSKDFQMELYHPNDSKLNQFKQCAFKTKNTPIHLKIKSNDKKSMFEENKKLNLYTSPNYQNNKKQFVKSFSNKKNQKHIKSTKSFNNINNKIILLDICSQSKSFKKIAQLWEKLGVTYNYQNGFKKILSTLDNEQKRENFLLPELNKLNKINEMILKIKSMITEREKIILDLHNNDTYINKNNIEVNKEKITKILYKLKKITYKICDGIANLRKEIGYELFMNKFDINKILVFQKDYIIKMKNDLDFLLNSKINNIFNFKKSDPFLLNIKFEENENEVNLINIDYETLFLNEILLCKLSSYKKYKCCCYNQNNNYWLLNSSFSIIKDLNRTKSNFKCSPIRVNISSNQNNSKISHFPSKTYENFNKGKVITANKGLSKQKLGPKTRNNKKYKEEKKVRTQSLHEISNKITKYTEKLRSNKIKEECSVKNREDKKIIKSPLKEDDLIIFDKIIEQSIREKNIIDEKFIFNRNSSKNNNNDKKNSTNNNTSKDENDNNEINKNKSNIISLKKKSKTSNNKKHGKKNSINTNDVMFEKEISNILDLSEIEKEEITKNNDSKDNINNNIKVESEPIKKSYSTMKMELFNGKLSCITSIYKNYVNQIPNKLKIAFNIQSDIKNYIVGIYPKIILIKNNKNDLIGIVTLNYEAKNTNINIIGKNVNNNFNKILNITSISIKDEKFFDDLLLNTINFCNDFFYYEYLILQLYYENKNEEFILFKDLETSIKNKAKFKWINMENDGITRKIKYKYTNKRFNDENIFINNNNVMNMNSVFILGFDESINYNNFEVTNINAINDFAINYCFIEMNYKNFYKIFDKSNCGNNYLNNLIKSLTFKKINQLCSMFITSQIGKVNDIKNFINDPENIFNNKELIKKINSQIFNELFCSIAVTDVRTAFKNIIKKKYNGYIYNIIFNEEINIFSFKFNNIESNFYLIHTNDENNFSIIVFPLNENSDIKNYILNNSNEMNLSELFKNIYSEVIQKPTIIKKLIYLPSFKINNDKFINKPSIYSDVIIDDQTSEKQYKINSINYVENISFGIDETLNYQQNIIDLDINFDNCDLNGNEEDSKIIVDNDFVFSIVNNDLIYECQIPAVATFLVKKEDWVKYI